MRMSLLMLLLLCCVPAFAGDKTPSKVRVYFGTYTGNKSQGIYRSELDLAKGTLSEPVLAGETKHPSFIALHPNGKFLYAVTEQKTGAVTAFAIDEKGDLKILNTQPSGGSGACHINVDRLGKTVLAANYNTGSCTSIPLKDDGSLGEPGSVMQHKGSSVNKARQNEPHAHSINVSPDNRFAFVADLGIDKIMIYKLDAEKGTLTPNDPPSAEVKPGSGPRHLAFHPNGTTAYVINELKSTITQLDYDAAKGTLTAKKSVSTLPAAVPNNTTAEVVVHPSGKFVYGSNRGHNSIAIFKVDPSTQELTPVGHQTHEIKTPRNFNVDPTGQYLLAASQGLSKVVVFRIDQQTGELTPTGSTIEVGSPVCVRFQPLAVK